MWQITDGVREMHFAKTAPELYRRRLAVLSVLPLVGNIC